VYLPQQEILNYLFLVRRPLALVVVVVLRMLLV
jgi:hypothetical protein